jgi:hypothetical protein
LSFGLAPSGGEKLQSLWGTQITQDDRIGGNPHFKIQTVLGSRGLMEGVVGAGGQTGELHGPWQQDCQSKKVPRGLGGTQIRKPLWKRPGRLQESKEQLERSMTVASCYWQALLKPGRCGCAGSVPRCTALLLERTGLRSGLPSGVCACCVEARINCEHAG